MRYNILIPLAEGFEEIEAMAILDTLRRADLHTITCSLDHTKNVKGAHGVTVVADQTLADIQSDEFNVICLPGGMPGSTHLRDHPRIIELVQKISAQGGFTAAICAAPMVLAKAGLLKGKKATCYPGMESHIAGALTQNEPVVVDGKIITGSGPGSALHFALRLVEELTTKELAQKLAKEMLVS